MTTFRPMAEDDAPAVAAFMTTLLAEDPTMGGGTAASAQHLAAQVKDGLQTWLAIDNGTIVGVIGPLMHGERATADGHIRSFDYLNRGVTQYAKSEAEAFEIAKALALAVYNDVQAQGKLPDDTMIEGATACRGAGWCRKLRFEETDLGDGRSRFIIPTALIPTVCKAAT